MKNIVLMIKFNLGNHYHLHASIGFNIKDASTNQVAVRNQLIEHVNPFSSTSLPC